jgi:glycosyltransferase involved in cell wall biosynthesis
MRKKKILLLSDHPLATSGVGTQARWLIDGLIASGKWSFRCFGGAVQHENYNTIAVNEDFIIKPTKGFGDPQMLRQTLVSERPDVLMLFTDPRFFLWVFSMEDEIHQICPIAYNHLWDNGPTPTFNKVLYESCDLLNCINYPTYEMVKEMFPERTNYVPHAVPDSLFFPMQETDVLNMKRGLLGDSRVDHFIPLFVGRNARRKMPSDILVSFKMFLDDLEKKYGHRKSTIIMHTDPLDIEGPNLHQVIDLLQINENVFFSKDRIQFHEMNIVYNISDVLVNFSCAEGFGLPVLEAKNAGKPIIAIKTGGLTRQVVDHETGEEFGVAIEPEVKPLVGNQVVPFIYEDFASHETLKNAFMKMYEMGAQGRKSLGLKARSHALKNYDMKTMINDWDRTLTKLSNDWKNNYERWNINSL